MTLPTSRPVYLSTLLLSFTMFHALKAAVLIDNDFGAGPDTGPAFQEVNNGFAASGVPGSADPSTGVISRGGNFNFVAFNNVSTVDVTSADPTATGFTATFVISGLSDFDATQVDSNGLFFGIVSGTDATATTGDGLYSNNPNAIGYVTSSDNYGDHLVRQDAENGGNGNGDDNTAMTTTAPTAGSFADGFTFSISVFNDDTWSISSTGLSTELNQTGALTAFTYNEIAGDVGLFAGFQNSNNPNGSAPSASTGGTLTMDQMSLVSIPEPSSFALLSGALAIGWILLRRRSI